MNIKQTFKQTFIDYVEALGIQLRPYEKDSISDNVDIDISTTVKDFFDRCQPNYLDEHSIEELIKKIEEHNEVSELNELNRSGSNTDNGGSNVDTFKITLDKHGIHIEVGVCSDTQRNIVIVSVAGKTQNIMYCNSEQEANTIAKEYSHRLNAN
jgi:hypothetical protein